MPVHEHCQQSSERSSGSRNTVGRHYLVLTVCNFPKSAVNNQQCELTAVNANSANCYGINARSTALFVDRREVASLFVVVQTVANDEFG